MTCRPAGLAHQGLLPSCRDRVLFFPTTGTGVEKPYQGTRAACPVVGPNAPRPATPGTTVLERHVCQDGLGRTGVHRNQGAEATLVFVATMLHLAGMPKPALRPPGETHGQTQAAAAKASRR